ncbi:MAG: hypothetical protein IH933_13455 [Euryarchaeota archaeon]|nr:hypothetical protein [Euryarchaeota archaeon]
MDRTPQTTINVPRRTVLRSTAGLLALGGMGSAAADGDSDDGDSDPTASVTFSDQTVANNDSGPTVTVDRLEMNEGGYMSIHQSSRFQFADGEDPDEYDVPVPDELENPICESLIGITEYLEPGVHESFDVPLFRSDSPAVELGAAEVGPLEESQVMIAIPHHNTTDEGTFNCPDDPSTPDPFEEPEKVDGAFQNGNRDVESIGVSHDLATVFVETDDEDQKDTAERQEELVRSGVLIPQPVGPNGEDEADVEEEDEDQEDEENAENDEEDEEAKNDEDDGENAEGDDDDENGGDETDDRDEEAKNDEDDDNDDEKTADGDEEKDDSQ